MNNDKLNFETVKPGDLVGYSGAYDIDRMRIVKVLKVSPTKQITINDCGGPFRNGVRKHSGTTFRSDRLWALGYAREVIAREQERVEHKRAMGAMANRIIKEAESVARYGATAEHLASFGALLVKVGKLASEMPASEIPAAMKEMEG